MSDLNEDTSVELTERSTTPEEPTVELGEFDHSMEGRALTKAGAKHSEPNKNSLCYDIFMPSLVVVLLVSGIVVILVANNWRANDPYEIAKIYHEKHPFIDGKNLLPYAIKSLFKGDVANLNLNDDISVLTTNIPRLKKGKLGGVVWSASMPCGLLAGNEGPVAVERTLYQIDIINEMMEKYSLAFELAGSEEEANEIFALDKRLSSMISVGGGHQIHDDLSVLRVFRKLGVVSMSLTADCSTSWAETENPYNTQYTTVTGLTEFGLKVVEEMNRVGVMVDLSQTSDTTKSVALEKSESPVIFSLSGSRSICDSTFNVPDSIFPEISKNGGVIMVPLFPPAICQFAADLYDSYRSGSISLATLVQQYNDSPSSCGVEEVFHHIDYLKSKLSARNVGISTNFDGNMGLNIKELEDPSSLIKLTSRLVSAGYSESDIAFIIGGNFLHAWATSQEKSIELKGYTIPSGSIFGI